MQCRPGDSIDMLPDDVLLEIFDFFVEEEGRGPKVDFEEWHTLVHVCRRWRSVVFKSPHRLIVSVPDPWYISEWESESEKSVA